MTALADMVLCALLLNGISVGRTNEEEDYTHFEQFSHWCSDSCVDVFNSGEIIVLVHQDGIDNIFSFKAESENRTKDLKDVVLLVLNGMN